jgi:hypothetical protein
MQSSAQEYAGLVSASDDKIVSLSQFDWKTNNFICREMARIIESSTFVATSVELRSLGADHRGHISKVSLTLAGGNQASTQIINLERPVVRCRDVFVTI